MFTIRTAAALIAIAAATPVLAQTPADLARLASPAASVSTAPAAPAPTSFAAADLARLSGAPVSRSAAPQNAPATAFATADLVRLMDIHGTAVSATVAPSFATAAR
jgi:hypothetical protein